MIVHRGKSFRSFRFGSARLQDTCRGCWPAAAGGPPLIEIRSRRVSGEDHVEGKK